jgi:hypothetical protein
MTVRAAVPCRLLIGMRSSRSHASAAESSVLDPIGCQQGVSNRTLQVYTEQYGRGLDRPADLVRRGVRGRRHRVLFAGVTGMACKRSGFKSPQLHSHRHGVPAAQRGWLPSKRLLRWSDPQGSRVSTSLHDPDPGRLVTSASEPSCRTSGFASLSVTVVTARVTLAHGHSSLPCPGVA